MSNVKKTNQTGNETSLVDYEKQIEELQAELAKKTKALSDVEAKAELEKAEAQIVKAELEAKIAEAKSEDKLNVRLMKNQIKAQKKVRISIASGHGSYEKSPVPIGLNGHDYLIVRDKEVDVPYAVLELLQNCKKTTYVEKTNEAGQKSMLVQEVSRFAVSNLGFIDSMTGELEKA